MVHGCFTAADTTSDKSDDPRAGTDGAMIGKKKRTLPLFQNEIISSREVTQHWFIVGPYVLDEMKQCLASGWMRVPLSYRCVLAYVERKSG